ncbi:MAG: gamma-glutamylcyclotransferase [Aliiglaciecola sp.]
MNNKLFTYGTLQFEQVQLDTFGRTLSTQPQRLSGYRLDQVEITDPDVLASSGERFHPIITRTDNSEDKVDGAIVLINDEELANADRYEVDDYKRVQAKTEDGQAVWVYVSAVSS